MARIRLPRALCSTSGARRLYRLDDAGIAQARSFMEQVWGEAAARYRIAAENTEEE